MATVEQEARNNPPYVSYATFKAFLKHLKEAGIPGRIDKSVMLNLSGGTQSHLLSTLRFLNLIGPAGEPRNDLQSLASAAETTEWGDAFRGIFLGAYAPVLNGLDLTTATSGQLIERFRETGVEGATVDKSIRFFVHAMKDAEIEHSPRLSNRKPRTVGKRSPSGRKQPPPPAGETPNPNEHIQPPPHPGHLEIPIFFGSSKGKLVIPESITEEDFDLLDLALATAKAIAKRKIAK